MASTKLGIVVGLRGVVALLVLFSAASVGTDAFVVANAPITSIIFEGQPQVQPHHRIPLQLKLAVIDQSTPTVEARVVAQPFALKAVPLVPVEILTKWAGVEADIRAEEEILELCRKNATPCTSAARAFLAIVAEGRSHTGRARIGVINRAINLAIRPMSDLAQWGVEDRWSAPLATLTTGAGDCDDYAIAKYVALMEAGITAANLRVVIVRDLVVGASHAIVAVYLDGAWLTLDNRWMALVDDRDMRWVTPQFVLGRDGAKQFVPATASDANQKAPHKLNS